MNCRVILSKSQRFGTTNFNNAIKYPISSSKHSRQTSLSAGFTQVNIFDFNSGHFVMSAHESSDLFRIS